MLHVQSFTFNALAEHTYVIYDETKQCAIIDPGCYEPHEQAALSTFITQHNLRVTHLINTHAHIDHGLGNRYVIDTYNVPLALHPADASLLQAAIEYAPLYGFPAYEPAEATVFLTPGKIIQIGHTSLSVLHVPGHSPGHIALYSAQDELCFSGDVLFQGSIGRTDLPGGDQAALLQSIRQQLLPLGDEVMIYPGHGPTTTIGAEKSSNPFLQSLS